MQSLRIGAHPPPGRRPGLNVCHPAAISPLFHGIAMGANFVDLLNGGVPGTVGGTPTAQLGQAGLGTRYATTAISTFSSPAVNFPLGTLALIQDIESASPAVIGDVLNNCDNGGAGGFGVSLNTTGALAARKNSTFVLSTTSVEVGPQFIAMSFGSSLVTNFVIAHLLTGRIRTGTIAHAGTASGTGNATLKVGNRGDQARPANGAIYAAMFSQAYLSLGELAVWARDPWGYWYPDDATDNVLMRSPWVGVAAAPGGFNPAWARNSNVVIGAGARAA